MKALFVTGTDTGVGKTTVSRAILAAAVRRGLRTAAAKPVESGCAERAGQRVPADAEALRQAAGGHQRLDQVCRYALRAPVAPRLAAAREGAQIDLDRCVELVQAVATSEPDLVLVEGAGGLLVPLSDAASVADLAMRLGHPVLIVARTSLGTINHSLMTMECASVRGLRVAGVVLCAVDDAADADEVAASAAEIARLGRVTVLGVLPHLPAASDAELAQAAERHLDLARLLG